MKRNSGSTTYRQAGFSLVEIMVGLVIGLLVTLIITQIMSTFETQKRTTTGTADAQTNGSIALYNIGREIQMAGYSLMPTGVPNIADSALECTTVISDGVAAGTDTLSPVSISDGANGSSDTITIRYGNSFSGGNPSPIKSVAGNVVTLESNLGCQTGDRALIIKGATCALSSASAVPATGSTGSAVQTTITLNDTSNAATDANLACLGNWVSSTYSVVNNNLLINGVIDMEGIVSLQAQYGISTAANINKIDQWVDAAGATWAAPTAANRNLIKAIRIAVVARNGKIEPISVTNHCGSLIAAAPTGLCAWDATSAQPPSASPAPNIDLSADANWQRYRYRVFETIIPLRNMIWYRSTL